jgi:hypothetical protein
MSSKIQLPDGTREDHTAVNAHVREVRAIQQQFASAIIAAGVFNPHGELWTEVIGSVAASKAAPIEAALIAFFDRLESRAPGSTRLIDPTDKHDAPVSDVLCSLSTAHADAGFLVGLAVGIQLGPHAFGDAR